MVTGNFALIAGIDPAQVEEWYLVVYADAYEWVELPNMHGMVLFADGGVMATSPMRPPAPISTECRIIAAAALRRQDEDRSGRLPVQLLYWNFLIENEGRGSPAIPAWPCPTGRWRGWRPAPRRHRAGIRRLPGEARDRRGGAGLAAGTGSLTTPLPQRK